MTTRSHSVTGKFLGRTKVRGDEYLTDGLALSVLRRQMEKGSILPEVRFTDDYIHFYNTDRHGRAEQNIPYGMIRKMYTFYDNPDILMTCSDMIYEDGKYYSSFRLRNSDDVKRARKLISGAHHETRPRARTISHTYTSRPARTSLVRYEPERTVYEPSQYRLISRTYRSASRSPSPIYIERAGTTTPIVGTVPVVERVIPTRTPSPIYVQPVSKVERTYTKPTETYMNETPAEPFVYRRVNRPAEDSVRTTYVSRPSVTYVDTSVPPRTGSLSRQYIGDELEDEDIVLKRISKVAPATR
ncbi:hypothetical protein FBUS_06591 [Fasciolopsis buskii]|uniref:Trematode PH-like domain-containing protein n=1 Tax=Fasciolopsis buskii TaxID=27845 RepID=A0A8E0VH72_9TREM|nr:hypothetical protein FBUS_06591 [Fasciolopsis buski]